MSAANAYVDVEAEVSSDDENFQASEDEQEVSENEEEETERLNKEMIADEDEIAEELRRAQTDRKRVTESTEDLVDDDYLLLEDHHGVKFNRKRTRTAEVGADGKRKRLQRRIASDEEDETEPARPARRDSRLYEEDNYGLSEEEDEEADADKEAWLVDDVARGRRKRPSVADRKSAAIFGEAGDIFGDMTDFLAHSQTNENDEEIAPSKDRRDSKVEPSLAARHMVTAADDVIRGTDQPERLQSRIAHRIIPDEDPKELLFQEAEWIHQTKYLGMPPDTTVPLIMTVLEMIRSHNLDVPYIQTYQKDYYSPMRPEDIWIIDQCDQKWDHIVAKRISVAKQLEKHCPNDTDLSSQMICSVDEEEIEDIRNFVITRAACISGKKHLRRSQNVNFVVPDDSIESLTQVLFLDSRQVGQNFRSRFLQHEPIDPDRLPEEVAEGLISDKYATAEAVLAAVRRQCAASVASDPFVRCAIRERFMEMAVICTIPTEKGMQVIDWAHEYYEVKHLVEKPIRLFFQESSAQFSLLSRAESEGFISSTIRLLSDESGSNPLSNEFRDFFQSTGFSRISQQWNEQRRLVFEEVVDRFLFKNMDTIARQKLLLAAQEVIVERTAARLHSLLSLAPLPRDRVVCACSVGDRGDPSYAVVVDRQGLMVDYISLPHMKMYVRKSNTKAIHDLKSKKGQDARRFRSFIERYSPGFIAVSADCLDSREFISEAKSAIQNRAGDIPVEFIDPSSARIAMNSRRMAEEFHEHPALLRQAVALARFVQDPLTEICSSAVDSVDLISLPLDPLQDFVPRGMLLSEMHHVLTDYVNHVGVDVNLAVSNAHLQGPLSFVSGLGPRKSKAVVDFIKRNGSVSSREDFLKIFGECVYKNCIGFLKIVAPPYTNMQISPLDESRIHPEHYLLSDRVVLNALDIEADQSDATAARFSLISRLRTPAQRYKLDELDLQAYAEAMEKEGEGRYFQTLQLIKAELKSAFVDQMRHPFEPESPKSLFHLLSGEQPDVTLYRGQIVDVVVTGVTRAGILARLDSGLQAFIPSSCYPDSMSNMGFDEEAPRRDDNAMRPGSTIRTRVTMIDYDRFRVELTASERDMADKLTWETRSHNDPYNTEISEQSAAVIASASKPAKPKVVRKFIPRNIDHPLFSNVDRETAEDMLKDAPIGDVVIRPSRLGTHQLTITWKFAEEIFVHIAVAEHDKPNEVSKALGQRLSIENEQFEDLDEILARYIRPLTKYAESIVQESCFRFGTEAEIDRLLKDEKEDQPKRIPYFFGYSTQHPGLFVFSFLGNTRVHHDLIKLTPKGYRFQKRFFTKASQIISFVKAEFVKQLKSRARQGQFR